MSIIALGSPPQSQGHHVFTLAKNRLSHSPRPGGCIRLLNWPQSPAGTSPTFSPASPQIAMPPEKYRVAIIGRTGKGNYGHGLDTVWVNHPRAEIVGVADEDEAGRAAAQKRLHAPAAFADYKEMLAKTKPHIVSVAPRFPDCHRDMVLACAGYGASMFLEKPVSRSLSEADEMVAACDRHHVQVAIAHQTVYSPRVKMAKKLIADGVIGDLLELNGFGKCDRRGGGEDLMVLGTHTFDLMRFLAGNPRWAFARISMNAGRPAVAGDVKQAGENIGPVVGDHIVAQYGFPGNAVARFTTHQPRPGAGSKYWLEVRGTKGVIQLGYGIQPPAYLCAEPTWMTGKGAQWQPITAAGLGVEEKPLPPEYAALNGNRFIADDLIAAIEEDREPQDCLRDGVAALEMIMAVYESFRLGQPVNLPLKNRKHPLTML
ncbi:MAG: Gfo/Idh/MocA family oxidoreductase [Bacteroidales bacterium]|nr:Gfo/Idh/MocA family oxidoreductase [Bacteroidales bacterium]